MDRKRLDQWIEWGIIGLILACLIYGPLAFGAVRPQDFVVLQFLTFVATALWIVRFWINPRHRILWPAGCWAVAAFAVYAVIRYWFTDVEYIARQELVRVLIYAWVFFLVLNNLHHQRTTRLLVIVLLGLGTIVAIYAVCQFLSGSNSVWGLPRPSQYKHRGSGTYICPDDLAGFLEMLVPIALAGLLISKSKAIGRIFYAYATVVLLAGIGVTVSRGGYLSVGLALLVLLVLLVRYRGYRLAVISALVLMAVGGVVFLKFSDFPKRRIKNMLQKGQPDAVQVRWYLMGAAARMWMDHFWWGVGPGQFDVRFPAYRPVTVQSRPIWAHNDYLNALADWGIVGGAIIFIFLGCVAVGAVKTWHFVHRAREDLVIKRSDRAAYVMGLSIGLLAIAIHSMVDFNMHIPANALVAIVLLASLTSHLRFASSRYWITPRLPGRILATVVGVASLAWLGPQAVKHYRETRRLVYAEHAPTTGQQAEALLAAYHVDPKNPTTPQELGEVFRRASWLGRSDWLPLIQQATNWFGVAMRLDPYSTYNFIRYGMCLDWIGENTQAKAYFTRATTYFKKASQLDPNNCYVQLMRGWHEIQRGDYPAAKDWLRKAQKIIGETSASKWATSLLTDYLEVVNAHLPKPKTTPPKQ